MYRNQNIIQAYDFTKQQKSAMVEHFFQLSVVLDSKSFGRKSNRTQNVELLI